MRIASSASRVPGTDARTEAFLCVFGIFAKSGGRLVVAAFQGPASSAAENQRPAARK